MKYIITESQDKKIRFMRRVGYSPRKWVVIHLLNEKGICDDTFELFLETLTENSIFSWMTWDDMEYMNDFIRGEMWFDLKDYYDKNCG